jgi:hypothetical protein
MEFASYSNQKWRDQSTTTCRVPKPIKTPPNNSNTPFGEENVGAKSASGISFPFELQFLIVMGYSFGAYSNI